MSITGHQLRRRRVLAKEIIELAGDKKAFIKRFEIDADEKDLEDKLTSNTARLAEIKAILVEESRAKKEKPKKDTEEKAPEKKEKKAAKKKAAK